MRFILLLLLSFNVQARNILPDAFYSEDPVICQEDEVIWKQSIEGQIKKITIDQDEAGLNALITLSYLELFKISKHPYSTFMSYVYANASHHLGRLVRFTRWPQTHDLKDEDQKLVKGRLLRVVAATANHELSSKLMKHSRYLYIELATKLAPLAICGKDFTESSTLEEFIQSFVTYEQTFLQKSMYQDPLIQSSARSKLLDEMRFISFNGEEHESFKNWCKKKNCGTSSFDLASRISFDVYSIKEEVPNRIHFDERIENAKILKTADVFIK